jgi:hypothetical protein
MASFRSAETQANWAAQSIANNADGSRNVSLGSERSYKGALEHVTNFMRENRLGDIRDLGRETAIMYLEMRATCVGQSTLDQERQAMQYFLVARGTLTEGERIDRVHSELETVLSSRAYTGEQVAMIALAQSQDNALATKVAECAGLRAHELLTIHPAAEQPASSHREWTDARFHGRDGERYTVIGKGGLCREIVISRELSDRLESTRLAQPRTVTDRCIFYQQHYQISGGQKWSQSFSAASMRQLGWSSGAHGVRHEYAQVRMCELQESGYAYHQALGIVSQEMGHFREDITEVYLR